jgi:hypothetical protein
VTDTTRGIAASTKPNSVDTGPSRCRIARLKAFCSFIDCFRILMIGLFATACLTAAAAHARQFSPNDFAPGETKNVNGWWSPERAASTVVAPHLQLNMSKLTRFAISEPPHPSTTELRNYSIVNRDGFELMPDTRSPQVSSLAEADLLSPRSFISLLQGKYVRWEVSLADTRSLISVNGLLVYPLVQIDYAQGRLPISLYIPPLRGSEAR